MARREELSESWVDGTPSNYYESASESSEDSTEPERYRHKNRVREAERKKDRDFMPSEHTSLGTQLKMPKIDIQTSPRRRKDTVERVAIKSPANRQSQPRARLSRSVRKSDPMKQSGTDLVWEKSQSAALACINYIFAILGHAMISIQKPLGMLLALVMLYGLVMGCYNLFTSSIYHALTPICWIPGIGYLGLPLCNRGFLANGQPEFDSLMQAQTQFESMLADTTDRVSLPMDLVRTERSIKTLKLQVKYSTLPSRNELAVELDEFADNVDLAGERLGAFLSRVSGTAGKVVAINRWTMRTLEDVERRKEEIGIVPMFFNYALAPFGVGSQSSEKRIIEQYIQHTQAVSGHIDTLLDDARSVLSLLDSLDSSLDSMSDLAMRDRVETQGSKAQLLRDIRTYIGMNRGEWDKYNEQLRLLDTFGTYQQAAVQYVASVIVDLQKMKHNLRELKDQVEEPSRAAEAGQAIPLSVHIDSIQLSIERLEEGNEMHKEAWKAQHQDWRSEIDGSANSKHKYLPSN